MVRMGDATGDALKREAGYNYILERVLRHYDRKEGPRAPYVILDRESTIRYVGKDIQMLTHHEPEMLIGKKYEEFLSWDMYAAALRSLAQRADRTLALSTKAPAADADPAAHAAQNKEFAQQWYKILIDDFGQIRRVFSPPGKVASVNDLVKEFEQGTEQKKTDKSRVRVKSANGEVCSLDDEFTLYRAPDGSYAGMFVTLTPTPKKTSWKSYFTWKTPHARIVTNEYVVPVYGLTDKAIVQRTLSEMVMHAYNHYPKDQTLVLDLGLADDIDADALQTVLGLAEPHANAGTLVVGNAHQEAKDIAIAYFKRKNCAAFVPLEFPTLIESTEPDVTHEIASHEELAVHVNKKLNQLEDIAHGNRVSGARVPPVQTNPQG